MMDERMIECAMHAWVRGGGERKQFCIAPEGHLSDYVTTKVLGHGSAHTTVTASSLCVCMLYNYTTCMDARRSQQLSSRVRL